MRPMTVAIVLGTFWLGAPAQAQAPAADHHQHHDRHQMPEDRQQMMERCKEMMADHAEMQREMQAMDRRLDELVTLQCPMMKEMGHLEG